MIFDGWAGVAAAVLMILLVMAFFIFAQMITDELKISFIQEFLSVIKS